jgi:hypothetical protein
MSDDECSASLADLSTSTGEKLPDSLREMPVSPVLNRRTCLVTLEILPDRFRDTFSLELTSRVSTSIADRE